MPSFTSSFRANAARLHLVTGAMIIMRIRNRLALTLSLSLLLVPPIR